MRHGEAFSNVREVVSCWPEKFKNPLTKKGRLQIKKAADKLKKTCAKQSRSIDLIFSSPLLRTKETAQIVGEELNVEPKFDKKLREIDFGIFNSKQVEDFVKHFIDLKERIKGRAPKGENYTEVTKRMFDFLKKINKKYKDKNILIVSHQAPLLLLRAKIKDASVLDNIAELHKIFEEKRITKGELIELN